MNIKMNNNSSELNSLLIATTVFAIGGLGLFLYNSEKSSSKKRNYGDGDGDGDEDSDSHSDNESESGSDLSIGEEEFDILDYDDVEDSDNPRTGPKKGKTKRNLSASSKTKKRR